MSERYTKLFTLPANLYAEGAPVIVSAGNLLKDTQTGKVLAQLKIKNISPKTIKAAKLVIHALDTTGQPLDGDAEQEYLDLHIFPVDYFCPRLTTGEYLWTENTYCQPISNESSWSKKTLKGKLFSILPSSLRIALIKTKRKIIG